MVKVEGDFIFTASDGTKKSLLELFEGRRQLIMYDFMLFEQDKEGCVGCSFCMDHIPPLAHLHSRDTTFVAVAPAAIEKINAFKARMGWEFPFYSLKASPGATGQCSEQAFWRPHEPPFGLSVFIRQGTEIFHTYSTTMRGVEPVLATYALLDLTPLGRQEEGNGIGKFRLHDQY